MVVGAKVRELTDGFLWFVCGLYVGILTSPLSQRSNFNCEGLTVDRGRPLQGTVGVREL